MYIGENKMEYNELSNRGKFMNFAIIFANMITFVVYMIGRYNYSITILTVQNVVRGIAGAIAVGCLVYTIILMNHNTDKKIRGFGVLLAACIVTLAFSIIGIMLGVVIWILCGISIRQFDQSFKEASTMQAWDHYAQNQVQTRYGAEQQMYGQDPYGNQQMYGQQNTYGAQGAYAGQNAYNMQAQVHPQPEVKVASHPNGFGVQEEPEIDFSDL